MYTMLNTIVIQAGGFISRHNLSLVHACAQPFVHPNSRVGCNGVSCWIPLSSDRCLPLSRFQIVEHKPHKLPTCSLYFASIVCVKTKSSFSAGGYYCLKPRNSQLGITGLA